MKRTSKSLLLWFVALTVTLLSAYYQRRTGPSYPLSGSVVVAGETIVYHLPRSHAGAGDARVTVPVDDSSISGVLEYRRYKSADAWQRISMTYRDGSLTASLPHQPPAGKVMYRVLVSAPDSPVIPLNEDPAVIRFRGSVPIGIMIPHIILMFVAMLLATRTGLEALTRGDSVLRFTLWTTCLLFVGGLILGPIVQKFAFGSFWTGWPFGHDLTDNKTFIAFAGWVVALIRVIRNPGARASVIVAALILLTIYLIPHSVLGSELDHTTAVQSTSDSL